MPRDPETMIRASPIAAWLGLRLASRSPESAELTLAPGPEHVQEEGLVHGGILVTLADSAAVYVLLPDLPEERTMASIDLAVTFLRPARADAGELRARARLVRRGRTVGVCEVEVEQAGRLVAKGLFSYLFAERRASPTAADRASRG